MWIKAVTKFEQVEKKVNDITITDLEVTERYDEKGVWIEVQDDTIKSISWAHPPYVLYSKDTLEIEGDTITVFLSPVARVNLENGDLYMAHVIVPVG